jgi:hypothetical protein
MTRRCASLVAVLLLLGALSPPPVLAAEGFPGPSAGGTSLLEAFWAAVVELAPPLQALQLESEAPSENSSGDLGPEMDPLGGQAGASAGAEEESDLGAGMDPLG